jgi:hypothetical protein
MDKIQELASTATSKQNYRGAQPPTCATAGGNLIDLQPEIVKEFA